MICLHIIPKKICTLYETSDGQAPDRWWSIVAERLIATNDHRNKNAVGLVLMG
ncbi:hypothetical Protein YC6258_03011 [Gynuella sunshinyii YC6258]|uniref:Uncharacterized protein n=1 Tax=Gynuella sunshinyii YC6258 TaxID=1445510 RepID=A0A0C5V6G5_9GAMM|nr:hypothetical Protein YC6258_03011 [Gynuella sunshinyii YC6258]